MSMITVKSDKDYTNTTTRRSGLRVIGQGCSVQKRQRPMFQSGVLKPAEAKLFIVDPIIMI